jgi:hypothetical protein
VHDRIHRRQTILNSSFKNQNLQPRTRQERVFLNIKFSNVIDDSQILDVKLCKTRNMKYDTAFYLAICMLSPKTQAIMYQNFSAMVR